MKDYHALILLLKVIFVLGLVFYRFRLSVSLNSKTLHKMKFRFMNLYVVRILNFFLSAIKIGLLRLRLKLANEVEKV